MRVILGAGEVMASSSSLGVVAMAVVEFVLHIISLFSSAVDDDDDVLMTTEAFIGFLLNCGTYPDDFDE